MFDTIFMILVPVAIVAALGLGVYFNSKRKRVVWTLPEEEDKE